MTNMSNETQIDNRPPKELRTLKRGDVRDDGKIFFRYQPKYKNGECWLTKDVFDKRCKDCNKHRKNHYYRNPQKVKEYKKKWLEKPQNKLAEAQRRRINKALRGISKSKKTLEILGCSFNELVDHLESQFQVGMNWDNYGYRGWHVDHIKPCASFDLSDPSQQEECFHYTNLQPLWAEDNLKKRNKING